MRLPVACLGAVLLAGLGPALSASTNGPAGPGVIFSFGTDMFYVDLGVPPVTTTSISLSWESDTTFPFPDYGLGEEFDLRYATSAWDRGTDWNAWWNNATQVEGEPLPTDPDAGSNGYSGMVVTGLRPGTTFWFYMRARKGTLWGNLSTYNGVTATPVQAATLSDDVDPSAPSNVRVLSAADGAVTVGWISPGNDGSDGTAARYVLRYSQVDPGSDFETWWNDEGTLGLPGLPAPQPAGTAQSVTIPGLQNGASYWFALVAFDEADNQGPLSEVVSATPLAGLDDPSGSHASSSCGNSGSGSACAALITLLAVGALILYSRR